jgi:hypothetical protein
MAIYTAADLHPPRRNGKGAASAEPAPPAVEVLSLEAAARLLHLNERTLSKGIEEGTPRRTTTRGPTSLPDTKEPVPLLWRRGTGSWSFQL